MSNLPRDEMEPPLHITLAQQFEEHIQETFDLCFSPDGTTLLSSDGEAIFIWTLGAQEEWILSRRLPCFATCPRFAPDGKLFVFRDAEGALHLSLLTGEELATLTYPHQSRGDSAFSPDQRWLVSGNANSQFVFWDVSTYQLSSVDHSVTFHVPWQQAEWTPAFSLLLQEYISSANHLLFTPNGQYLVFVAASDEGYVHICRFDASAPQLFKRKTLPLVGIDDQKISPDGKWLAISCQGTVFLYEMQHWEQVTAFEDESGSGYTLLTFSADGHFLASSTYNGDIAIWSMQTLQQVVRFAAHPDLNTHASYAIGGLDWSRTGYIATGGSSFVNLHPERTDYTVKLWKVIPEALGPGSGYKRK